MKIIRSEDQEGTAGKAGSQFTGDVWPYLTMSSTDGVVINTVTFSPGARTYWHRHENGQILQVLSGRGYVCAEGGEPQVIRQGDTVWCPPGERHWHGASADAVMTHTAISLGTTQWAEPVTDEEYRRGNGAPLATGPGRPVVEPLTSAESLRSTSMSTTPETHQETYEQGLQIRREVLGAAHVDRSMQNVSDFSAPIQELVTEYCWGKVWSREGLERKTRSLINLAMITALNRNHELSVHVRGAVTNGATEEEIREVLLQTAIYVGVPAALESFRVAEKVLGELRNA